MSSRYPHPLGCCRGTRVRVAQLRASVRTGRLAVARRYLAAQPRLEQPANVSDDRRHRCRQRHYGDLQRSTYMISPTLRHRVADCLAIHARHRPRQRLASARPHRARRRAAATLSLNWHFNPNGTFRPYIGAGVHYTMFSGEETCGTLSGNDLTIDDSVGAAGQVGVDIGHRNWFF